EELGLYGPQSVQQVLTRKYISARVERRVAEIIGIPLEKLFPDRYRAVKRRERVNNTNLHEKTRDTGRAS
ncbi:MAG: helix-turn-helix domain-containing protein, partial [Gammaproteobacteria bacterium]|nr:helix-turn-helix domain-containing protein [Gammaproteobacteria bacterium]